MNSFWIYNVSFYSISLEDLQDIVRIDNQEFDCNNFAFLWTMDDYIFYLTSKNHVITVSKTKKIIGFCISFISQNESELYKIVVEKDYRDRKIGKIMLIYHLGFLKFKGVKTSFLEVASDNYKAIGLYKKIGYREIGLRKEYYGKIDAILMKKDL
ncbi:MAG: GNAT family N-acetyltransferase [bacterium]